MIRKVFTSKEEFFKQNKELETNLPYSDSTEVLKERVSLGSKTVKNRLACQAMEGCDGNFDGTPGELTYRRYERFSKGGAGIIWFEATAVVREGRANPRQLFIDEKNLDEFKKIVEMIKETGLRETGEAPFVVMQATHSGRYSKPNGSPEPIIAYNNPIFEKDKPIDKSRIIKDDELDAVGEALAGGAYLAEKAGFDGVDIKCCHRYLNSELLSAFEREGRYGGSFENRTRLLRESIAEAKKRCGKDFTVTTRLNVYDGFPYPYGFGVSKDGGTEFDEKEPVMLLKELEKLGVGIVNVTMGNPYFNPHVNRPFAMGGYEPPEHPLLGVRRVLEGTEKIKKNIPNIKLICSALSYLGVAAPNVAAGFIERGAFDFAGFGRTIFAYPDFAADILREGVMKKEKSCICCSKCTEIMRAGGTPGCVIRDGEMYMPVYKEYCRK